MVDEVTTKRNQVVVPMSVKICFELFRGCGGLWRLVNEFEELVQFRRDDNLCAAVALATNFCVVGSEWIVFAATCCAEARGVYAILIL